MKTRTILVFTLMMLTTWSPNGFAKGLTYEEIKVPNGGSISGTALFKGKIPAPILEDLNKGKNSEFCATHPDTLEGGIRPRQKVAIKEGQLKNAVIYIENISKGKSWPEKGTSYEFKHCDIFPKVSVIRKAPKKVKTGVLTITNQDEGVLHNPHGYSIVGANRKTLFNKPLPSKGAMTDVTTSFKRFKKKKDKHFFLQCDQHNFMEADARIVWNPYYAISAVNGAFSIENIPAGAYKVTAWHPYLGQISQELSVSAGSVTQADFELAGK